MSKRSKNRAITELVTNDKMTKVTNGLQGALFGGGFPGGGVPQGPHTQDVSQVNNIFNNLRWYFISNFRQALSEAYCELGLIQTVVDVPVDDGLRGGVEIRSKKLSPEQLEVLQDRVTREDDIGKVKQGLKWTRLFGGGGVLILTDQDPTTPLDLNAIGPGSILQFRGVDMWELYFDLQNTEGYDQAIQDEKFEFYSYYGTKIHKSRVMKMVGLAAPSFLRPRLRGWGLSVVESLVRSVNQYLKGTDLIYELLDEAKIDVFGIKNLTNTLLNPNGASQVANRIQLANRTKNFQHALVMDGEDKYEQKTLTFSGLADVMEQVRMQVASDLRMPVTKVFGISAAGFNSGEDDIEVYNGMIESSIRTPAKKDILRALELRCQQLFGFIPDDLSIEFQPLRVLSGVQKAEVEDKQRKGILELFTSGLISLEEARAALNKHDLAGIQLSEEHLPPGADQLGNVPGQDEEAVEGEVRKEDTASSLVYGDKPPVKEGKPQKGSVKKDHP